MEPLISVIVPVYNTDKYIKECLDSILKQSYQNIEVIIVNDGSKDSSKQIIEEYISNNQTSKKMYLLNKENGGLSSARNYGLDYCSGEYVGFVDSDDYIDENMYEIMYKSIQKEGLKIAMCGRIDVYHNKNKIKFSSSIQKVWDYEKMSRVLISKGMDNSVCNKLFSMDIVSDIRFPEGKYFEDSFFTPKALSKTQKVVHVGKALYFYRRTNENSITRTQNKIKYIDWFENTKSNLHLSDNKIWIKNTKTATYLPLINLTYILKKRKDEEFQKYQTLLRKKIIKILVNKNIPIKQKIKALLSI